MVRPAALTKEQIRETYQQPTRNNPWGGFKHRVVPAIETSEILAQCLPEVDSRILRGVETNGLQLLEVQLFAAVIIPPLWYPDPVWWEGRNRN
jgi:hypothetical protein